MKKFNDVFYRSVGVLALIVNIIFFTFLFKYNILPGKFRILLLIIVAIIILLFIYFLFTQKKSQTFLKIISILLIISSILQGVFISYAKKSINTVEKINQKIELNSNEMSFVVLKDSNIKSLEEIGEKEIATAETSDEDSTMKTLHEYKIKYSKKLKTKDYGDYLNAAKSILDGDYQVMLLNEGYRPLLEESIEEFSSKTRVLESVVVTNKSNQKDENKAVGEQESFNVYISGIDTYGNLSTVSRSDVNMIVSVNPKTKNILITTIPRDTYLAIGGDNNKKDKLTHAGLFGVDTSKKSLEKFLDISINYYGKVNFTTLTDLIDVIGGITVNNPVNFNTSDGTYSFPKGQIEMDGAKALAYSRERYNLSEGDFDRGKNQTRVMEGIIKRMLRPEMLLKFNQTADIILKSVNTDVPYSKMIEMVNDQLDNGGDWKIQTQALKGRGAANLKSYLMPNSKLYMMKADENSIKVVHQKIEENNKQDKN